MFKDYKKYLSTSLQVYLFVLIIIFILKIVGLDYFGLDTSNPILTKINEFALKYKLDYVYYFLTLSIYNYIFISICSDNKKIFGYSLLSTILMILLSLAKSMIPKVVTIIIQFFIIYLISKIINKNVRFKKVFIFSILNIIFQIISLLIRNNSIIVESDNFIKGLLMNLDYIIMCIILFKLYFTKGENGQCQIGDQFLSSLKKISLKKSLQKLRKNFQNNIEAFKKQSKEEKLTIIIFSILSLIWNTLTVVIILIIAKLNDTLIECIFILTSFWLSKRSFGKAFHFDSMIICFIVSNLTYYVLNRITAPLGISMIIPILLGVGLSYVTSKFVKKTYKPLNRGMSKELFEETILQVTEKGSDKYNICYDFYIEKKSDLSLSYKYNYSVSGIRKIKDRINEKIKRL